MASIVVLVVVSLELGHFFGFDVQKSLNVRFIILLPGKVKIKRLAGAILSKHVVGGGRDQHLY